MTEKTNGKHFLRSLRARTRPGPAASNCCRKGWSDRGDAKPLRPAGGDAKRGGHWEHCGRSPAMRLPCGPATRPQVYTKGTESRDSDARSQRARRRLQSRGRRPPRCAGGGHGHSAVRADNGASPRLHTPRATPIHATTPMDPEDAVLSETHEAPEDDSCRSTYTGRPGRETRRQRQHRGGQAAGRCLARTEPPSGTPRTFRSRTRGVTVVHCGRTESTDAHTQNSWNGKFHVTWTLPQVKTIHSLEFQTKF